MVGIHRGGLRGGGGGREYPIDQGIPRQEPRTDPNEGRKDGVVYHGNTCNLFPRGKSSVD